MFVTTLSLLHLFLIYFWYSAFVFALPLLLFALLLLFMFFGLLSGFAITGHETFVPGAIQKWVSRRRRADAGCSERCRKLWKWLAEPLRHGWLLRVTVSPIVAGVIADIWQCFERTGNVQHWKVLGAGRRPTIRHRNSICLSSTCLSSPIGGVQLAIKSGCCSLAGEVWYSGLFVDERIDEVSSRSFLEGPTQKQFWLWLIKLTLQLVKKQWRQ